LFGRLMIALTISLFFFSEWDLNELNTQDSKKIQLATERERGETGELSLSI
jgi:hypothetical protein